MYYKIREDNATPPTFSEGYVHYRYDDRYQLTEEHRKDANDTNTIYKHEFVYDDAGNRTSKEVDETDTTAYTYNQGNQLVTEDAPSTPNDWYYKYDTAGNMRYKVDSLASPATTFEWQYNSENRLTTYDPPGASNSSTYTYNLLGSRVRRQTPDLDEKYVLAGADVIADYNGASSDALLREYLTPGLDDNAIVFVPSDDDYYYFKDGLGSVRNIIDTSGDVQNYYDYEAFGSPYDAQSSPPVTNRYTYTGRELDGESTTYYYRFRQYHAGQGRFSARDPIPAGRSSMYAYVRSNPCYFKDPFGLQEEKLDPELEKIKRGLEAYGRVNEVTIGNAIWYKNAKWIDMNWDLRVIAGRGTDIDLTSRMPLRLLKSLKTWVYIRTDRAGEKWEKQLASGKDEEWQPYKVVCGIASIDRYNAQTVDPNNVTWDMAVARYFGVFEQLKLDPNEDVCGVKVIVAGEFYVPAFDIPTAEEYQKIDKLLKEMGSEKYKERETATRELIGLFKAGGLQGMGGLGYVLEKYRTRSIQDIEVDERVRRDIIGAMPSIVRMGPHKKEEYTIWDYYEPVTRIP